ncbi:MAG TPA: urea ABC transporter permease subunit UrtB [Hypericibacter adhaerens]|jgi:urea transport system permease protein|uniref:Branched-chain amino acid ABC transporter permease n=1 Tax=Hypericibacter adhaerens TaxID=2602016 RepID=A0A5J6MVJ9_9PROT|nr:urea ABC transporter permease subunit UrtB [Hypericibacter adhaerens]QEX20170.1 branched-chain amino acid ABC transporter permease [Hypericibacter adhaerens]HWA46423.1 urea ABC transporter permease subunit UrtB [Hypericibacter adhaerens]
MQRFRSLLALLCLLCAGLSLLAPNARAQDMNALVDALAPGSFKDREAAVTALAATGDPAVVPVLEALANGDLYARKSDQKVFIAKPSGTVMALTLPLTGESAGEAQKAELEKVKVNNALRSAITNVLSGLTLFSPAPEVRRQAALEVLKSGDPASLPGLERAMAKEPDPAIAAIMKDAVAAATLRSDRPEADKIAAIETLSARADQNTAALLSAFAASATGTPQEAALAAAAEIERALRFWDVIQNVWYGISLGSVLLLAAIGLAITFGVMGVINMAHGEMVMLGAYTTYVVQDLFRAYAPDAFGLSLAVALPAAFLVAGGVGILIERSVIRFLYGRPLETLLATWGVSLILQQAVRTIFGASNKEVGTPEWMSGSIELVGGLSLTLNRAVIVIFAISVFALLMLAIRKTPFGLYMRAVTQNRPMANAMGIRSGFVDAMTFGLGSGIAGIAGVALSQIDNVSPNLGQNYIIDSFLVVVFGGAGNLWGTLVGALTLGVANKFLEPFAGAVLGKIIILVAVILFIQKRPRGLFALKGRWVDA